MTFKNLVTLVVTSVCALLVTTSCSSTRIYHPTSRRVGHGPPRHAPQGPTRPRWDRAAPGAGGHTRGPRSRFDVPDL